MSEKEKKWCEGWKAIGQNESRQKKKERKGEKIFGKIDDAANAEVGTIRLN